MNWYKIYKQSIEKALNLSSYGYWLSPSGQSVPVPQQKHEEVAQDILGKEKGLSEEDAIGHFFDNPHSYGYELIKKYNYARVVTQGNQLAVQASKLTRNQTIILIDTLELMTDNMPGQTIMFLLDSPNGSVQIRIPPKKISDVRRALNELV